MRRAVGDLWPILSAVYGIHPWDVDRLTVDELTRYVTAATAATRSAAQQPPATPDRPGVVTYDI